MSQLPVLYKTTKTGAIQQWSVVVSGGFYQTFSGQKDGALISHTTKCTSKGVGKAETTPYEQAEKEALAKWKKQFKKGYVEDIESLKTQELTLPMLAKKVQDHLKKIVWGKWLGLVKLNGVRCTMFYRNGKVFFQSRTGEEYPTIKRIADELTERFFAKDPSLVIDGELYCHGMFLEDIVACVKKHNEDTDKIIFHAFDLFNPECQEQPYAVRHEVLKNYFPSDEAKSTKVKFVGSFVMHNEEVMWNFHDNCVELAFEGIIVRDNTEVWQYGARSATFLKLKKRHDAEAKIVGFEKDKNGGAIPVLECDVSGFPISRKDPTLNPEGTKATFKATFAGTHYVRTAMYANQSKLVGKWMNFSYEHLSKYGIPAKPISEYLRDCNELGQPLN